MRCVEMSRNPRLHALKSVLASTVKRLDHPFKLSFAVTYRCNLRCQMCNIWRKPADAKELSIADIDVFLARTRGLSWVGLTGGEPFLRPDLPQIVESVHHHCGESLLAVHFATNGQLVERIAGLLEHLTRMKRRWQPVFTVSIDGPPELHDEIRGRAGTWDRAVETLRLLKCTAGIKAQVGFALSTHNLQAFADTCAALEGAVPGFRRDDVTVSVFHRSDFYYDNTGMPGLDRKVLEAAIDEIQRELGSTASSAAFLRSRYLRLYKRYATTHRSPVTCRALSSICFLDPAGDLYPCAIFNRRLINVREMTGTVEELWRSPEARSLAGECARGRCPSCWNPCDAYSSMLASPFKVLTA
ncbi:MAG: radical SAM protein [Candidatus Methylomirabilia bacterium]